MAVIMSKPGHLPGHFFGSTRTNRTLDTGHEAGQTWVYISTIYIPNVRSRVSVRFGVSGGSTLHDACMRPQWG